MSTDITIGGAVYRTGRMNAKTQFHVARRLLPVLSALTSSTASDTAPPPENPGDGVSGGADPAAEAAATAASFSRYVSLAKTLASVPDADCDYVIAACLGVCQRQQTGGGWAMVWNAAAGIPQFSDIDLATMMQLTVAVIKDNLGSFLSAPAPQ